MTLDETPVSRRELREREAHSARLAAHERQAHDTRRVALAWVDEETIVPRPAAPPEYGPTYSRAVPDLLADRPRRRVLRPATVLPVVTVAGAAALYAASTLLWPLYAVEPVVTDIALADVAAPASAIVWPEEGTAAVGIEGFDAVAASSGDASPIASVTKLVTMLMVLEQSPLAPGEQGPSFEFSWDDYYTYWDFLYRDESALEVPVDGTLTQYQLMQGVLIGSAGNYAERLAGAYWEDDEAFAAAAADWLQRAGLTGIEVVEPTGIDEGNRADAGSLVALSKLAMAQPVIAEIVRMPAVELPGAGYVENTNELLADPQVVGVKTGSLYGEYTLTAAKEFAVGETSLRAYAAVLAQPDSDTRFDETARLLSLVAAEASRPYVLPAGTRVATVTTAWGVSADVVTATDIGVTLWNAASATPVARVELGDARGSGDEVGEVSLTGPVDAATTGTLLTGDIPGPDAWWRLTHPLQLWGLAG